MICHNFESGLCLSCGLLGIKDKDPLEYKAQKACELLAIDQFDSLTHSLDENYRNKVKWAISGSLDAPLFGFFGRDLAFHNLAFCPILMQSLNAYQKKLSKVITDLALTPYDPVTGRGELKYIILFSSPCEKKHILRFVLRSKEALDRLKALPAKLQDYGLESIKVISVNLQPDKKAVIEGKEELVLSDESEISFDLNGHVFKLGVRSFFQVNHQVAKKLYKKAHDLLAKKTYHHILDLYCGVGGFALHLQDLAPKLSGVEISQEAIQTAKEIAKLNNLAHLNFYAEDLAQTDLDKFRDVDVVVVNPPRRGLDKNTLEFIKKIRPEKILYSSCNPMTLKRDQNELEDLYKIKSTHAFDMFNLTEHLEILCELEII